MKRLLAIALGAAALTACSIPQSGGIRVLPAIHYISAAPPTPPPEVALGFNRCPALRAASILVTFVETNPVNGYPLVGKIPMVLFTSSDPANAPVAPTKVVRSSTSVQIGYNGQSITPWIGIYSAKKSSEMSLLLEPGKACIQFTPQLVVVNSKTRKQVLVLHGPKPPYVLENKSSCNGFATAMAMNASGTKFEIRAVSKTGHRVCFLSFEQKGQSTTLTAIAVVAAT